MTPEQKLRIIGLIGIAGFILLYAEIKCIEIYASHLDEIPLHTSRLTGQELINVEEVEAPHRAASRKRARGPASTGNDRRKLRRLSTAQAFSDVKNTIESAVESLIAAIREVASAPNTSIYSIAISTVANDPDFSQNEIDDAFAIFTNKPQVAEMYAAITNTSARTRFLRRRLNEFQMEKMGGIGMN